MFDLMAILFAALLLLNATPGMAGDAQWLWRQPGNGRLLLLAALIAPFCFDWAGLYATAGARERLAALGRAAAALASLLAILVAIAAASAPDWPLTGEMLVEWAALTLALLMLGRAALLAAVSLPPIKELARERVAILGSGSLADRVVSHLEGRGTSAARLVGLFDDQGDAMRRPCGAEPRWRNLRELAMQGEVDRVVIALPSTQHARATELARELAPFAIDVAVCSDPVSGWTGPALPRSEAFEAEYSISGLLMRRIVRRPLRGGQVVLKALEDRALGLLLLIGLSPLLLVIAAAVRLTSPGSAFFKQSRHGFRSREFTVYKFRTMRADAADWGGRVQTTRGDPRITPLGAFLRASSLDELPQLINVVRGEMSLVGPRPLPIDMRTGGLLCSEIVDDYANRHRVKPGITGWAQVNGYRGATTTREQVAERVRLDNSYIDSWSLLFDLKILLLTAVRVIHDENAF